MQFCDFEPLKSGEEDEEEVMKRMAVPSPAPHSPAAPWAMQWKSNGRAAAVFSRTLPARRAPSEGWPIPLPAFPGQKAVVHSRGGARLFGHSQSSQSSGSRLAIALHFSGILLLAAPGLLCLGSLHGNESGAVKTRIPLNFSDEKGTQSGLYTKMHSEMQPGPLFGMEEGKLSPAAAPLLMPALAALASRHPGHRCSL